MTEGDKLKLVRTALGLSGREFAKELGTSQGIISGIETGNQLTSRRLLELMRDKFSLNLDWFLNERGEMFGKPVPMTQITGSNKDEIIRLLKEQILQLRTIVEDKEKIIKLLQEKGK